MKIIHHLKTRLFGQGPLLMIFSMSQICMSEIVSSCRIQAKDTGDAVG